MIHKRGGDVAEIGIIGGADGPTSILITTSVNGPLIIVMEIIVVLAIGSFIVWKKNISSKLDICLINIIYIIFFVAKLLHDIRVLYRMVKTWI